MTIHIANPLRDENAGWKSTSNQLSRSRGGSKIAGEIPAEFQLFASRSPAKKWPAIKQFQTEGDSLRARPRTPSPDSQAGRVAGPGCGGVLPVLCRSRKHPCLGVVPHAGGPILVPGVTTPEPEEPLDVGDFRAAPIESFPQPGSCMSIPMCGSTPNTRSRSRMR